MALIHRICQTCGKAFMRSTTKLSRDCKACERSFILAAEQWADEFIPASFARYLERSLAAAHATIASQRETIDELSQSLDYLESLDR
jgi:predicted  nucleic acid-binding Zn-ribbon protein